MQLIIKINDKGEITKFNPITPTDCCVHSNAPISIRFITHLLKPGWVAMNADGTWHWHEEKPYDFPDCGRWCAGCVDTDLSKCFNIAPSDCHWQDSLIEII